MNGVEKEFEGGPPPVKKWLDYLQWEEYFMAVAFLSAQRSKDPNSQIRTWCDNMCTTLSPFPLRTQHDFVIIEHKRILIVKIVQ